MACPICGLPDAGSPCPRCGTDLVALEAPDGETRLDIRPVARARRQASADAAG